MTRLPPPLPSNMSHTQSAPAFMSISRQIPSAVSTEPSASPGQLSPGPNRSPIEEGSDAIRLPSITRHGFLVDGMARQTGKLPFSPGSDHSRGVESRVPELSNQDSTASGEAHDCNLSWAVTNTFRYVYEPTWLKQDTIPPVKKLIVSNRFSPCSFRQRFMKRLRATPRYIESKYSSHSIICRTQQIPSTSMMLERGIDRSYWTRYCPSDVEILHFHPPKRSRMLALLEFRYYQSLVACRPQDSDDRDLMSICLRSRKTYSWQSLLSRV